MTLSGDMKKQPFLHSAYGKSEQHLIDLIDTALVNLPVLRPFFRRPSTQIFASRPSSHVWSNFTGFTERLSRGLYDNFPLRSVQSLFIRRQRLPLSDLNLAHHDRFATIDLLHNAMYHRADPVHLALLEGLIAAFQPIRAITRRVAPGGD